MRPSLRFLAVAVVGWAGIRAATLGALPGAELFKVEPAHATPPPIVQTQFPPVEPVAPAQTPPSVDGGRGMFLVNATAHRWGCLPCEGGKVVWASLAR